VLAATKAPLAYEEAEFAAFLTHVSTALLAAAKAALAYTPALVAV
jgi:hypothetical protein